MRLSIRIQQFIGVIALLLLTGCNSTPHSLDNKYVFSQFEQVDRFTSFSMNGWQAIDSQSLIVNISPKKHYLLVLSRKLNDLRFAETIELTSKTHTINAKFDCVKVKRDHCGPDPIPVSIHSIYKLQSKDDIATVKQQILAQ
jgi:hypothetical protein